MKKYDPRRVINGTYGEIWLGQKELQETTALEIKVAFDKSDVNQCGQLMTGKKITAAKGTGTIKMNKIRSYMSVVISNQALKGSFPAFTLISKLKDPDAYGAERVKVTGVTFDEFTLADWEVAKTGELSYPFTFTGFQFIDKI